MTGKGGVGKTTVSYALGLAAAAAGKRSIVCEIARQEHGSALFGRDPIGFNETELTDGLWAISIDPDKMVREYLEVLLPVRAMASLLIAATSSPTSPPPPRGCARSSRSARHTS